MKQRMDEADNPQLSQTPQNSERSSKNSLETGMCIKWLEKSGNCPDFLLSMTPVTFPTPYPPGNTSRYEGVGRAACSACRKNAKAVARPQVACRTFGATKGPRLAIQESGPESSTGHRTRIGISRSPKLTRGVRRTPRGTPRGTPQCTLEWYAAMIRSKRNPSPLPEELTVELYQQGNTLSDISRKIGLGQQPSGIQRLGRIRGVLKRAGVYRPPGRGKKSVLSPRVRKAKAATVGK